MTMTDTFPGAPRSVCLPAALPPAGLLIAPVARVHGSGLSDARLDATVPPPRGAPV